MSLVLQFLKKTVIDNNKDFIDHKFEEAGLKLYDPTDDKKTFNSIFTNGNMLLFTKGADDKLIERADDDKIGVENVTASLKDFGASGYRTLVYAWKKLEIHSYNTWDKIYTAELSELKDTKVD